MAPSANEYVRLRNAVWAKRWTSANQAAEALSATEKLELKIDDSTLLFWKYCGFLVVDPSVQNATSYPICPVEGCATGAFGFGAKCEKHVHTLIGEQASNEQQQQPTTSGQKMEDNEQSRRLAAILAECRKGTTRLDMPRYLHTKGPFVNKLQSDILYMGSLANNSMQLKDLTSGAITYVCTKFGCDKMATTEDPCSHARCGLHQMEKYRCDWRAMRNADPQTTLTSMRVVHLMKKYGEKVESVPRVVDGVISAEFWTQLLLEIKRRRVYIGMEFPDGMFIRINVPVNGQLATLTRYRTKGKTSARLASMTGCLYPGCALPMSAVTCGKHGRKKYTAYGTSRNRIFSDGIKECAYEGCEELMFNVTCEIHEDHERSAQVAKALGIIK